MTLLQKFSILWLYLPSHSFRNTAQSWLSSVVKFACSRFQIAEDISGENCTSMLTGFNANMCFPTLAGPSTLILNIFPICIWLLLPFSTAAVPKLHFSSQAPTSDLLTLSRCLTYLFHEKCDQVNNYHLPHPISLQSFNFSLFLSRNTELHFNSYLSSQLENVFQSQLFYTDTKTFISPLYCSSYICLIPFITTLLEGIVNMWCLQFFIFDLLLNLHVFIQMLATRVLLSLSPELTKISSSPASFSYISQFPEAIIWILQWLKIFLTLS